MKEQEALASETEEAQTQVLKRVERADAVIATLERSTMTVLDCSADPTSETMPALRALIKTLEGLIRHPCDFDAPSPLSFGSLLDRLDAVVELNTALADVERHGMALFMATSTAYVKVPRGNEEGFMSTGYKQKPEYVMAARFMIGDYQSERVRVTADVRWPLENEPEPPSAEWGSTGPFANALDDDIPF